MMTLKLKLTNPEGHSKVTENAIRLMMTGFHAVASGYAPEITASAALNYAVQVTMARAVAKGEKIEDMHQWVDASAELLHMMVNENYVAIEEMWKHQQEQQAFEEAAYERREGRKPQ